MFIETCTEAQPEGSAYINTSLLRKSKLTTSGNELRILSHLVQTDLRNVYSKGEVHDHPGEEGAEQFGSLTDQLRPPSSTDMGSIAD